MSAELLENLPNWAWFIIYPSLSLLVLLILMSLFRIFSKYFGLQDLDTGILDTATQNVMSGAYVILGFVLVLVMATVNDIDNNVSKEASQIETLDRLLIMEGSSAAKNTRHALLEYTKSIVTDEWGQLTGGAKNPTTRIYAEELFKHIKLIEPTTTRQSALFIEIVKAGDDIAQSRNLRIMNSQSRLPVLFWQLSYLTLLGVIIIAALRLIKPSHVRVIALSVQLSMISWLLATVMILDLPYLGQVKASPEAFQRAINLISVR
jgi:hypothetical protein